MNTADIILKNGVMPLLSGALQRGCVIDIQLGCSIREFLHRECHLNDGYISTRIKTFFLNSRPVDDIDAAILRDSAVLALSGAMPGLVGTLMRSGTMYSSLRNTITHREEPNASADKKKGQITIKLFNVLIRELGPGFFARGVYLGPELFLSFVQEQQSGFWEEPASLTLNGKPADSTTFHDKSFLLNDGPVFISINS